MEERLINFVIFRDGQLVGSQVGWYENHVKEIFELGIQSKAIIYKSSYNAEKVMVYLYENEKNGFKLMYII